MMGNGIKTFVYSVTNKQVCPLRASGRLIGSSKITSPDFTSFSSVKLNAFTLIELLVVIAIITLLVSILLPSLNAARDLAKQTACMAQLKSLGTTTLMYANDYDGVVQAACDDRSGSYVTWYHIYQNEGLIVGDKSGYRCPSYEADDSWMQIYGQRRPRSGIGTSYNSYFNISDSPISFTQYAASQTRTVNTGFSASEYILYADSIYESTMRQFYMLEDDTWPIISTMNIHARHNGSTANCWFVDGHAAAVSDIELSDLGFSDHVSLLP